MPFEFKKLAIPGVVAVQPKVFDDGRGSFTETYKASEFIKNGITESFVQHNQSISEKDVLRGLHYQLAPTAQGKLVRVVVGSVFDVVVDIRPRSEHFGKWASVNLTAKQGNMLYVPAGFAHGFCVTSDVAYVLYLVTEEYAPDKERGIAWDDPDLNINWLVKKPVLSDKDKEYPVLKNAEL